MGGAMEPQLSRVGSTFFGFSASQVQPFAAAIAFLLFFLSAAGLLLGYRTAVGGYADFRHLYVAGYMARTGHGADLYDYRTNEILQNALVGPAVGTLTFNHLAYEALIFVPFSLIGYRSAFVAFLFVNSIILALCIRMIRPHLAPLEEVWTYLPIALFLCFLPVAMALRQGQDSIMLLALTIASALALEAGKDFRAGILLGLTLFKFQYALPIALLYLVWRRWQFLAGFSLCGGVLGILSMWLTGFSGFAKYLPYLISMSARFSAANGSRYGIHPEGMANLRGLVSTAAGGATQVAFLVTAGLSLLVLGWAGLKRRPSLPLALLAAVLVSYHYLISDTVLLLLPLGLLVAGGWRSKAPGGRGLGFLALGIYLAVPVLLFARLPFCLLALPTLALFGLWDGTYLSPGKSGEGLSRPQKETA